MVQPEKPRSKIRIYLDILRAIEDGGKAKPTRVLQKANLSHDRLTKYLGELVEKKLVSENEDNGNRYYSLTAEGIKFLDELKRAETFISGFGLSF
ncbi:MAG: winged helix-turn-helix domain-containing protein [Nitrososphaerales archaeon]